MCENQDIHSLFMEFQKSLESEQEIKENIRILCKEINQYSREASTLLQVIHRNEAGIPSACFRARELFTKAHNGYTMLKGIIPETEYFKYQDNWRYLTQKFCYLISLVIWLETGNLASQSTVAEILGIKPVAEKVGFHLDIEDYLIGLLLMCAELARLAINAVTRGDYNLPVNIFKFVMELSAGFSLLNFKNDYVRKRYDALKYDVKKVEGVVYDLTIRGLVPQSVGTECTGAAPVPGVAPVPSVVPVLAVAPLPAGDAL